MGSMKLAGLCLVVAGYLGLAAGVAHGFWPFAGYSLSWSIFGLSAVWSIRPSQYLGIALGVAFALDLLAQDSNFAVLKVTLVVASLVLFLYSRVSLSLIMKYGLVILGTSLISAQLFLSSSLPTTAKLKIALLNFIITSFVWLAVSYLQWPQKNVS